MSFKVGDRVRINERYPARWNHGHEGVIMGEPTNYDYYVRMKTQAGRDHDYLVWEKEIDLIPQGIQPLSESYGDPVIRDIVAKLNEVIALLNKDV